MTEDTIAIVGASLAGAKAAETLRDEGFSGRVVLIGEEPEPPYERPPLSKDYLLGDSDRAAMAVHDPTSWYRDHDIELRLDSLATAVHRGDHEIELDDGTRVSYSAVLLATGASPRHLPIPGADLAGVHYLRTVGDSDRLRETLREVGRVAVVGAGWIGLEVAAAARWYDCEVTVIETQDVPLENTLGTRIGEYFAEVHRRHGVELLTGHHVAGLRESGHRVRGVTLREGDDVDADAVVIAVGARPNTDLAQNCGLALDNGVVVDSSLRTADPDVFAAGDVASVFRPFYGRHLRVEHWATALTTGPAAARSMLGRGRPYDELPYFFTDQYDIGMEFAGLVAPDRPHTVVTRDVGEDAFHAFWLAEDRVVAGMHVNCWDDGITPAQELIRSCGVVDPRRLADASVPLRDVVPAPA